MDKVFTVLNIGTGHNILEEYNIFVQLWNRIDGSRAEPCTKPHPNAHYEPLKGPEGPIQANPIDDRSDIQWQYAIQAKLINDGPAASFNKPGNEGVPAAHSIDPSVVNPYMKARCDETIERITELKSEQSKGSEVIVNMVGHSRGAILCIMIAEALFREQPKVICNMFLIDPVDQTTLDRFQTQRIYANTVDFKRILMEDDPLITAFPPANIMRKTGSVEEPIPQENTIRLPGTHGTASQCNPKTMAGSPVAAARQPPDQIWPIGDVALRTILRWLSSAGTRIAGDVPDDLGLFKQYVSINLANPLAGPRKRVVNDIPISIAGPEQSIREVTAKRPPELLDSMSTNPYRFSGLIINEQHADLFKVLFPEFYAYSYARIVGRVAKPAEPSDEEKWRLLESGGDTLVQMINQLDLSPPATCF